MASYTISASQLNEGSIVLIRGKLGFSRLVSLIEGAELAASDARKVQNGMSPVGKPHTTVTITESEVLFKDPASPTLEERFVDERRYASSKNPGSGANYSVDNKSMTLPVIAAPNSEGKLEQIVSDADLASGLDVTLVLRVFKPKNYANRGLSLDQVVVNEPVRFYTGGASADELASRGFVFATPPRAVQAQVAGSAGTSAGGHTQYGPDGLAMPSPAVITAPAQPLEQGQTAPAQPQGGVAVAVAEAPAAAPSGQDEETVEQKLARLEAENKALQAAQAAPTAAVPAEATAEQQNPWNPVGSAVAYDPDDPWAPAKDAAETHAGITYQG